MGKRTKQYKRLMRSFELLGFRQPYQLLMTSDVLLDTLKLDLIGLMEKTLSTKNLKPMITQCCIRALYAKNLGPNKDPAAAAAIERAKTFERRRCGHLMDEDPLTERECVLSVVDYKGRGENKFRYIVATQDEWLRARLRPVVPTPLMYVRRSVVILEPMSSQSSQARDREEKVKFLDGIVRKPQKRKREEDDSGEDSDGNGSEGEEGNGEQPSGDAATPEKKKKKKSYGPKGPNPLSVKKPKAAPKNQSPRPPKAPEAQAATETKSKRKRRKKGGALGDGSGGAADEAGDEGSGPAGGEQVAVAEE